MAGRRESAFDCLLKPRFLVGCMFLFGNVLAAAQGRPALAAIGDDFESGEITWRPGDADVQYRLESHARITADPHSGQRSELLQISAGAGTYVYFTHEMGTARIVAELSPSVWVKANRPGIQLLARVILPHTTDPRSGQPASALLSGSSYNSVGMWQQLALSDTPQLLNREVRALRAQMGPQVDAREAYVDQLLLNVYGGPGQTIVNIDDLAIAGVVPYERSNQPATMASAGNPRNLSPAMPEMNFSNASAGGPPITANGNGGPAFAPSGGTTQFDPAAPANVPVGDNSFAPRQVVINGSLLLVDGKPMFPRIIQSQGEPLEWLKQEGFNVVRTTGPITNEMLAEAQRTGMLLIGPPPLVDQNANLQTGPGEIQLAPITPAFAPVLAWHLGSGLAARELPGAAALARQLRLADRQLRRPLVCSPEEESLAYSRQVDVLSESRPTLDTSLELKDYGAWLSQRPRLARPGVPLWAVVQTEAEPAVVDEAAAFFGSGQPASAPVPTIDVDSLRLTAYLAFCSGMRGLEFASRSRLDSGDNFTRLRAASLALLNLELDLISPWGAAGNYVTSATSNDPNISSVVLNADKARLVVAMRLPNSSQYVPAPDTGGTGLPTPGGTGSSNFNGKTSDRQDGNAALKDDSKLLRRDPTGSGMQDTVGDQTYMPSANRNPLFPGIAKPTQGTVTTLVVPGVPEDYRVYEITPAGLRPLRCQRVSGGTAIAIEDFLLTSLVLITADPAVENALQRRTTELAPRAAQLQRTLTAAMLEQTAAVAGRLAGQTQFHSASTPLATAQAGLQQADAFLSAGQYAQAYLTARNAAYPLEHWKRETWEQAIKPLPSPVSSPLAVSFNTLPEQINFAASTTRGPPGENVLIGGDFENLQTMLQAGWQHFEHAPPDLQTSVELSPLAPYADRHSLHLQVQSVKTEKPADLAATLVESPPLWVTSAPVRVNAGDIVCIRGQVRVPRTIVGSVDGLMILDSLGGEALAQRITQTDGWREFVMYRAAAHADNLTVTFALSGVGEAWIDELSIRPIRRADMAAPASFTSLGWPNPNFAPRR
ncbi:MAG TPA: hypothetical protein VMJ32_10570 [Pirellulales bacterium]|nr:hypothetical protein [Pirellulales bacterium]